VDAVVVVVVVAVLVVVVVVVVVVAAAEAVDGGVENLLSRRQLEISARILR